MSDHAAECIAAAAWSRWDRPDVFIGTLPANGDGNAAAKLIGNMVRRFAGPAPFEAAV